MTQQLSALCLDSNTRSLKVLELTFRTHFHACLHSRALRKTFFHPAGCSTLTHMIRHASSVALPSAWSNVSTHSS